jgi:phosphate/sulfate permease
MSIGGKEMDIEIAIIVTGVLILVGAIIAGGAIYAGLEKIADAINKQK